MLFSKQPFFCLSRTAFNQSSMARKDARQTAMRGSGGHFNNPKFWLFLAIGDNFERFMVERIFLGYLAVLYLTFCVWQGFLLDEIN